MLSRHANLTSPVTVASDAGEREHRLRNRGHREGILAGSYTVQSCFSLWAQGFIGYRLRIIETAHTNAIKRPHVLDSHLETPLAVRIMDGPHNWWYKSVEPKRPVSIVEAIARKRGFSTAPSATVSFVEGLWTPAVGAVGPAFAEIAGPRFSMRASSGGHPSARIACDGRSFYLIFLMVESSNVEIAATSDRGHTP